jgi:hypothetical protein
VLGWKSSLTLADMCRDMWHWQTKNPAGYYLILFSVPFNFNALFIFSLDVTPLFYGIRLPPKIRKLMTESY